MTNTIANKANMKKAFQQVYDALVDLDETDQERVLSSVSMLLGIGVPVPETPKSGMSATASENALAVAPNDESQKQAFSAFGDLYHAADPKTHPEKALVAGYWLQECKEAEIFNAQSANDELKLLGYTVPNVTDALTSLINHKPKLVLQMGKTGKTKQGRKTYKLTEMGINRVKEMINAE